MTGTERKLSRRERRFLSALALPAAGIALAYTIATTYAPVLIIDAATRTRTSGGFTSGALLASKGGGSGAFATGVIIGAEGIFALVLPLLIGAWSDRINTRLGGRMPFILAGCALAVLGLVLLAPLSESLLAIGFALAVFFVGYFTFYSPYYALYPDLVSDVERGRSMGFAGTARSIGLLVGLIAGALLISVWQPLPFAVGAAGIVAVTVALYGYGRGLFGREKRGGSGTGARGWRAEWELLRANPNIRWWAVANAMWEGAIAALKVFVVLYFTRGLGLSFLQTAGALALVGVAAIAAAPVAGTLADRYGERPVMLVATWGFGLGLVVPVVTANTIFLLGILPVAFCAVMLITLPYSMLIGMLPERGDHGAGAGLFGLSRGVGVLIGPLFAGLAISLLDTVHVLAFAATNGYAAAFAVSSLLLLASIPLLRRLRERRVEHA